MKTYTMVGCSKVYDGKSCKGKLSYEHWGLMNNKALYKVTCSKCSLWIEKPQEWLNRLLSAKTKEETDSILEE